MLRKCVYFSFLTCILIAGGNLANTPDVALAQVQAINLGRSCFNVVDFGADPTGAAPSTAAFQAAFKSASIINGAAVCAPAGTYQLTGDITLFSTATSGGPHSSQGGPSFFGAGPGLTILERVGDGAVFDSCPSYSNISPPSFTTPAPCPTVTATAMPMHTANPANKFVRLSGMVFSNFSITHTATIAPNNFADFNFPEVSSLLVDNVCVSGSTNVFDLGDQLSGPTWGPVTIRDSSCAFQFGGHFLGIHGGGGGLIVSNNELDAGGTGVVFDTTDMTQYSSGSAGVMSWVDNVIEQPFVGMFLFVGDNLTSPFSAAPGIQDSQWRGNKYDGCVLTCYYFGVDSGVAMGSGIPDFGHITVADRSASSLYDAVFFNGGFYAANGGVEGVQIGGPSSYSGSSGTANSLLMLRGSPSPGDQVWIVWTPGMSPNSTFQAPAGTHPTAYTMAQGLVAAITGGPPSPTAKQVALANPNYALIGLTLPAAPPPPSYTAEPYRLIINSGSTTGLSAVGMTQVSGGCSPPPLGPYYLCYSGAFDNGDAVALRNGAHDIDVIGARLSSPAGVAVHVWPDGGDVFHFFSNILGRNQSNTSYTGIQLDAPLLTAGPSDYYISGNDLVGTTSGIVNALPSPAYSIGATPPAMRAQRGSAGNVISNMGTGTFTVSNGGPNDCVYYFDWSAGAPSMLGLLYQANSGSTASSLSTTPPPAQISIPVGAQLSITTSGTVNYTGLCLP
jgi:Pectate lyase superfamily protein